MQIYIVHRNNKIYGVFYKEELALAMKQSIVDELEFAGVDDTRVYISKKTLRED